MMDWLAAHGSVLVLLIFFTTFMGFALWAYFPANKAKLENYGQIPLKENDDGE